MLRYLASAAVLTALSAPAAVAANEPRLSCLSRAEQRAAIASGQAVRLATAIRAVRGTLRGRGPREVVQARLCRGPNGLVYMLTVLARDGKVTRATVDAGNGRLVEAR